MCCCFTVLYLAAHLSVRFRNKKCELGALGLKVTSLRQKSTVLPEALVVEIVTKYISFIPRKSHPDGRTIESEVQSNECAVRGCVLHNFPRFGSSLFCTPICMFSWVNLACAVRFPPER